MAVPAPRRTQNRIMLRDGNNGDAHAQKASHYHCLKRTPRRRGSQIVRFANSGANQVVAPVASGAAAGTARVLAQFRNSAISSARVVESGTVCARASRSAWVDKGVLSEYAA